MKSLHALAIAAATAIALSACATVNPYHPAAKPGGYGYSEQRLETDRYRITFQGDTGTKRPDVENYLLFRSAEVTLQNGYDYFVVTNRMNETDRRTDPVYTGPYSGSYLFPYSYYSPRWGWRSYYDPFWSNPVYYREVTRYQASAEILMGKGPKPPGDSHAFDARQVQANLQAKVFPPPKS